MIRCLITLVLSVSLSGATAGASEEPLAPGLKRDIPELAVCRQLILVTSSAWTTTPAKLRCFERSHAKEAWKEVLSPSAASIGRNGMAWGIGLHGTHPESGPVKREGDGRAPAGVFALHEAFGYVPPSESKVLNFPYRQLTSDMEGIDDPDSRHYNRVVDASVLTNKDWKSSERMLRDDGLYRWGAIVEHNWKPVPGFGSCIFLHVWQGAEHGTAGCTAMPARHLAGILQWLKQKDHPLLVQLPMTEYHRLKEWWTLP